MSAAQEAAEDFAGGGFGDGFDELPLADFLVRGDAFRHEGREFGGGDFGSANEEGLGNFTGLFVGDADDGGVGDGRVAEEKRFEFGRLCEFVNRRLDKPGGRLLSPNGLLQSIHNRGTQRHLAATVAHFSRYVVDQNQTACG